MQNPPANVARRYAEVPLDLFVQLDWAHSVLHVRCFPALAIWLLKYSHAPRCLGVGIRRSVAVFADSDFRRLFAAQSCVQIHARLVDAGIFRDWVFQHDGRCQPEKSFRLSPVMQQLRVRTETPVLMLRLRINWANTHSTGNPENMTLNLDLL